MGPLGDFMGVLAFGGLAALAAIWFFVPFAIFGTKTRLDDLIDTLEETNKQLADIKAILTRDGVEPVESDIPSIRASR
jgi:hypothetical protein